MIVLNYDLGSLSHTNAAMHAARETRPCSIVIVVVGSVVSRRHRHRPSAFYARLSCFPPNRNVRRSDIRGTSSSIVVFRFFVFTSSTSRRHRVRSAFGFQTLRFSFHVRVRRRLPFVVRCTRPSRKPASSSKTSNTLASVHIQHETYGPIYTHSHTTHTHRQTIYTT